MKAMSDGRRLGLLLREMRVVVVVWVPATVYGDSFVVCVCVFVIARVSEMSARLVRHAPWRKRCFFLLLSPLGPRWFFTLHRLTKASQIRITRAGTSSRSEHSEVALFKI